AICIDNILSDGLEEIKGLDNENNMMINNNINENNNEPVYNQEINKVPYYPQENEKELNYNPIKDSGYKTQSKFLQKLSLENQNISNISNNNYGQYDKSSNTNNNFGKYDRNNTNTYFEGSSRIKPKSSALKNLIMKLKEENDYMFDSDEENKKGKEEDTFNFKESPKKYSETIPSNRFDNPMTAKSYKTYTSYENPISNINYETPPYSAKPNLTGYGNENNLNFDSLDDNKTEYKNNFQNFDNLDNFQKEGFNDKRDKINEIDIYNVEKRNNKFIEAMDEMDDIKNKIMDLNKKISRSVNQKNLVYQPNDKHKKKLQDSLNSNISLINKMNKEYKNRFSPQKSLNNSFSTHSIGNINTKKNLFTTGKTSFKEKYLELKEKYDTQKEKISTEKEEIKGLEKRINKINKKNSSYDKLVTFNKKLFKQEEVMRKQIKNSENIRKEQSKLIKSLKREVEMLRGDIDYNNLSNIAEVYQQMKNSLLKSDSNGNI
ncbi:MAG: hypothetical protein MJ252_13690, partial [archaeon]|nr:hypothetical protein [archaeon]